MALKKQIQLQFVETACTGGNLFIYSWKDPKEATRRKDRLEYYLEMAKIAEQGKVTSIFFADSYGVNDIYAGGTDATYRGGCQVAQLDPFMIISAMAAVTKSVGFTVSANVCYLNPYILARSFATLDHLTQGRVGWNIVTGYTNASARAMGSESIMPHSERYEKAEEFVDLTYRLLEGSWDDDAQVWDVENNIAYDPTRIRKVDYKGKYVSCSATQQTHPSPQRVPVLYQAGSSKPGIKLAGENAEGILCASLTPTRVAQYKRDITATAIAAGRDPNTVKIFPGLTPFVAPTLEEAQAKFDAAERQAYHEGGLAKFSGYSNIDMSKYPLDEPFELTGGHSDNAIQGVINSISTGDGSNEAWTPRKLGKKMAMGSQSPNVVGTPAMIVDIMEKWIEETDCDGFSLHAATFPEGYQDIVDYLVPEMQRRGIYWSDYAVPGGTLRENLMSTPGFTRLSDDHPAAKYRHEREAERKVREAKINGEPLLKTEKIPEVAIEQVPMQLVETA